MRKKILASLAVAGAMVVGTAGVAMAVGGGPLNHSTSGASFSGSWEWYAAGQAHGGYHYWGNISDTNCGDGDNVYSKVKVMGYSPNSFYGSQCAANVWQNWEVYDPQAIITTHAEYQVCRDRAFPYSDNCSSKQNFDR